MTFNWETSHHSVSSYHLGHLGHPDRSHLLEEYDSVPRTSLANQPIDSVQNKTAETHSRPRRPPYDMLGMCSCASPYRFIGATNRLHMKLGFIQPGIQPTPGHQGGMIAFFDNGSTLKHHDSIHRL